MQPSAIRQGTLRAGSRDLAPEETRVTAVLAGPIARVEVAQRFVRDDDEPAGVSCEYVFPLPAGATVASMTMTVGDRVVRAVVKEREEAKRQYEAALAAGRRASLLEEDAPSLFSLHVANVPPRTPVTIDLAYDEVLRIDRDEWSFVFPMTAPDRYLDAAEEPGRKVRPPRPLDPTRDARVRLEVRIPKGPLFGDPSSASHDVVVKRTDGETVVELVTDREVANRDFELSMPDLAEAVAPRVWFEREPGRPGTFLLLVTPGREAVVDPSRARGEGTNLSCGNCGAPLTDASRLRDLPGGGVGFRCAHCGVLVEKPSGSTAHRPGLPRDVVLLVDRSMSMQGSVGVARAAVRATLGALGPSDAFQLIAFDHAASRLDDDTAWLDVDDASIARAARFVADAAPRGGTELEDAMDRASKLPKRRDRQRVAVLVSDCAIGNEGRLARRARELFGDTRLFVLATGRAPDVHVAAKLADATGGAWDRAGTAESPTVARFADRVRQASPVLTDVHVAWDDALSADVYPSPVPTLFHGQALLLVGRYTGDGPSTLTLRGVTATGGAFSQEVPVTLPREAERLGLERLWAARRIERRLDGLAKHPEDRADVRIEVLGLALRHGLVTPFSSLVADDLESAPLEESAGAGATTGAPPPPAGGAVPGAPPAFGPAPMPAPMPARAMAVRMRSEAGEEEMTLGATAEAAEPPKAKGGFVAAVVDKLFGSSSPQAAPPPARKVSVKEDYAKGDVEGLGAEVGELDLVFIVDETGSMGPYIREVQKRLRDLVKALEASPLCKSLRLGLVGYRDHPPQDSSFVTRITELTDDRAAIRAAIDRMEAQGGGDSPEAVTDGLFDAVRLGFRPGAARACVWIADAPPHGIDPGDGFPDGCPCQHHWYTQAECAREMGIVIHTVQCGGGDTVRDVMKRVASTTHGAFLPLGKAELLVPLIEAAASTDLDRQRVRERIARVVAEHEASLAEAPPDEQQRFVRDVLRAEGVRARKLEVGERGPELGFRDVEVDDVVFGWDSLRRMGRVRI